jgi:hypothetical protein
MKKKNEEKHYSENLINSCHIAFKPLINGQEVRPGNLRELGSFLAFPCYLWYKARQVWPKFNMSIHLNISSSTKLLLFFLS